MQPWLHMCSWDETQRSSASLGPDLDLVRTSADLQLQRLNLLYSRKLQSHLVIDEALGKWGRSFTFAWIILTTTPHPSMRGCPTYFSPDPLEEPYFHRQQKNSMTLLYSTYQHFNFKIRQFLCAYFFFFIIPRKQCLWCLSQQYTLDLYCAWQIIGTYSVILC